MFVPEKIKLLWNLLKHIRIENNNKTWNTIVVCQRRKLDWQRQTMERAITSTSITFIVSDITDYISNSVF
jgi:hypothetical protein